ncbi:MAG: NADH-quinone oxidoreductase subunit K [Ilumatobacteraceae bacterium]|nr:MAG: NADH-quinone oxidoreductase subunit K [Actinomycetota bacterium]
MSVTLAATAAALFSIGTYLVLQRKLSRIIIGLALLSHGSNTLLMASGRGGNAPLIGNGDITDFSDPLPQALALTTVVITFGVSALLLALAFRSYVLTKDDEVEDDVGDRQVARGGPPDKEVDDEVGAAAVPLPDDMDAELAVYVETVENEQSR